MYNTLVVGGDMSSRTVEYDGQDFRCIYDRLSEDTLDFDLHTVFYKGEDISSLIDTLNNGFWDTLYQVLYESIAEDEYNYDCEKADAAREERILSERSSR